MTPPAKPASATILFVEGGPPTRRHVGRMLQGQGYLLLEASTGEEALGLAAKHQGPIALLVTDVVMPHMGGFTVGERLAESHPETRVLFLSGYTDQSVTVGLKEAGQAFLLRPFTHDRLLQAIREQLNTEVSSDRRRDETRRSELERRAGGRRVRELAVESERRDIKERRTGVDRRAAGDRRTIRLQRI